MIDRKALVTRHNPRVSGVNPLAPLTLGNGEFAVTVDATGLQSLREEYASRLPVVTMSHWAWHTAPRPEGYDQERFPYTDFDSHGRRVPYLFTDHPWWRPDPLPEAAYYAQNPHHFHLGYLGLLLDGQPVSGDMLGGAEQVLDLWSGLLTSEYTLGGHPVTVQTVCHPELDAWSVRLCSPLLVPGRLTLRLYFPYGSHTRTGGEEGCDDAHSTEYQALPDGQSRFLRSMDGTVYSARLAASSGHITQTEPHAFILTPEDGKVCEVTVLFQDGHSPAAAPSFAQTRDAAARFWRDFWSGGGALELAESRDPRAIELERRLVLSQYLTAVQSCGSLPPPESGLMYNSWNGKFHLEMHYWHAAHFALWGRAPMLARSLDWYKRILPQARRLAAFQGYDGARWPKCTGPDGVNAPCIIEPFLIWQQPHPIYYAELLYRADPSEDTLNRYRELVLETAAFMASFAVCPPGESRYVLGPPVAPAQERYDHSVTVNPCYELSYWRWGLETAQHWRARLGLPPDERTQAVLDGLSPLPQKDGVYIAAETAPDTFDNPRYIQDHPTMTASLGMLPGGDVDADVMRRTLERIDERWSWPSTWGWDYPMLAMTAARLGDPERAVDTLFKDVQKNRWLISGGNYQTESLPLYLPGNGGLLLAAAMMAAGWDGDDSTHAPGFPRDWTVRWEGLRKMP